LKINKKNNRQTKKGGNKPDFYRYFAWLTKIPVYKSQCKGLNSRDPACTMGAAELARGRGKQANFEFEYLTQKTRIMRKVFFPHLTPA